ncbi:hypothetical protein [Roseovarius ramblicola]|uniref:Acid-resistance membrane protein n=1 Tax=Roseovarius ramblicola TaxID=2022336 RepID=A0ABV5I3L0_9RHOB
MHDDPATSAPPPSRQGWRRFAGLVALYAVLGPLLGAVCVVLLFVALSVITEVAQGRFEAIGALLGRGLLLTLVAGLPIAYSFGAVSSVAVGLIVALSDRRDGGISWRVALGGAVVSWGVAAVLAALVVPPDGFLVWLAGLFAAHVVAAWLCTWLAHLVFGKHPRPRSGT